MSRRQTTAEFISKAKAIHGKKYNYSKVEYVNSKTKILITCSKHGDFLQSPDKHLMGNGCIRCGYEKVWNKDDSESFINKAKKIHGDKFDYSRVNYVNSKTKVAIICLKHGEFSQEPSSHLMGAGCKKCATEITSNKLDTDKFINRSIKIFGNKFDYSKTNYKDIKSDITLICSEHGEFKTNAENHLISSYSGGCKKCRYEKVSKSLRLDIEEFLTKAYEVWGDEYDYSEVEYINAHKKVSILCAKHGSFLQTPSSHLSGNGCPKCYFKTEGRIAEYLNNKSILHREYRIKDKRYDFYLPKYNLIIERDGEQHYRNSSNFASYIKKDSKRYLQEQVDNDLLKTKLAKEAGFKIARIPYWLTKKEEEIEIENILAGKPTYPDVPDLAQENTKPRPKVNL